MKCRLEVDSSNGRMCDGKFDDIPNLMIVHVTLNRWNERHVQPDLSQPIERLQLLFKNVGLAPYDAIGFAVEAIELKIEGGPDFIEPFQKSVVACDALSVRVDHHEWNAAPFCGLNKIDDLRMNRRLPTGKLNDLRITFRPYEVIQHRFNFLQCQAEARTRFGETERAVHITRAIHFNDAEAGVLLMVRTQSTIVRTTVMDLRSECQRDSAGLVVFALRDVHLGIAVDERFKRAAVRTPFFHEDFVFPEDDIGVDDAAALRANAASELVENVISIFLHVKLLTRRMIRPRAPDNRRVMVASAANC